MSYKFECGCGSTDGSCPICEATKEISTLLCENSNLIDLLHMTPELKDYAFEQSDGQPASAEYVDADEYGLWLTKVSEYLHDIQPVSEERGLTDTVKERVADPKIVDVDLDDL